MAKRKRTALRKRTQKRRRNVRGRSSLAKKIQRVLFRSAETKAVSSTAAIDIAHNSTIYVNYNLLYSTQGVTDNPALTTNRIGDTITPIGLRIMMQLETAAIRPNTMFFVWILRVPIGYTSVNGYTNLPTSVPLRSLTGNICLDPVDTEKCTVVRKYKFKPPDNFYTGSAATSLPYTMCIKKYIKLKPKNYVYQGDNSGYGKTYQLMAFAGGYDATSTTFGVTLGTLKFFSTLYFKDI